jgi:hypothetical protein
MIGIPSQSNSYDDLDIRETKNGQVLDSFKRNAGQIRISQRVDMVTDASLSLSILSIL